MSIGKAALLTKRGGSVLVLTCHSDTILTVASRRVLLHVHGGLVLIGAVRGSTGTSGDKSGMWYTIGGSDWAKAHGAWLKIHVPKADAVW